MYVDGKACRLNDLVFSLEKHNNRVPGTNETTQFEMSTKLKRISNLIPKHDAPPICQVRGFKGVSNERI